MEPRGRLKSIEDEKAGLTRRKSAVEGKLSQEYAAIRKSEGEREALVWRLASPGEDAAKLNRQIDVLDEKIKTGERLAEALQRELQLATEQIEMLNVEASECQRIISHEEMEKGFIAWREECNQRLKSTDEALTASRAGLGNLNLLAERGSREFGERAVRFLESTLDEFFVKHANCESKGWRYATPAYRPMSVMVHSMIRTEGLR